MAQEKERYLIIFNFGSFVYMFFIIGMSTDVLVAVLDAATRLVERPSLGSVGWALYGFITMPFGFGLMLAVFGAVGFLPYRWLCKRGWGWPTKGVFIKVSDPVEG